MDLGIIICLVVIILLFSMILFYLLFDLIKKMCLKKKKSPIHTVTIIRSNKIKKYGIAEDNETDKLIDEYDFV